MARKIRFPLIMRNGADVRTLEELRSNFDLETVLGYFENGKLKTWLEDRYYDSEAEAISALDKNDAELGKKICGILGVACEDDEVDMEEIERRNEKLRLIRQYSDDKEIIDNIDSVAFDQDDLLDILDKGIKKIYLCHGKFELPLTVRDVTYIGIDHPQIKFITLKEQNISLFDIDDIDGPAEILTELGEKYYDDKNYDKAFKLYEKAAEHDAARAQSRLGEFYCYGYYVSKDYDKALEWVDKGAHQGDMVGQFILGKCYSEGLGVEENYIKAIEWYSKAAEQGNANAQNNLGCCYEMGNGVQQSYEMAVDWYRKAAEQGNAYAQHNLGLCYNNGNGVEQSYEKAVEWYRKAAEQEYARAQCSLGYCYESGNGVQKSYEKAVEWYRKAAEQEYARAQCNLGYCYECGHGVEKNIEKAIEWYRKAAKQGETTAQNNLKNLGKSW